ncbi:LPXTG cell wall anchor domain-containing protein [Planosporangium sp. 12N6]|uniref:LPXTG cell wall anchor domain-containing protein n=1 Tax=Planosporangium spinosum TaxID=3402278 RepID=UPI003CF12E59
MSEKLFDEKSLPGTGRPARPRGRTWRRLSLVAAPTVVAVSVGVAVLSGAGGAAASQPLAGATVSVTPTGAVSAGGGGTAGDTGGDPTLLLSLAGAGLLGAGGLVMARHRRAVNE